MSQDANGYPLYIFLDEAGNLDFSPNGTKHFILSGLSAFRPFNWYQDLTDLQFKYLEDPHNLELEEFHATKDRQAVRNEVFNILAKHHASYRVDSIIVEKSKAHPKVREPERFYPMILKTLLSYIIKGYDAKRISEAIFVTDELPLKREREAVLKGIKVHLNQAFPPGLKYRIFHWDSKSTFGLQAIDYINWAIHRKWRDGDLRSHQIVQTSIYSEFDFFRTGTTRYY